MSSSSYAFDYFEHRYIGNEAYERAINELKSAKGIDPAFFINLEKVAKEKAGFWKKPDQIKTKGLLNAFLYDPKDSMAVQLLNKVPIQFGDLPALAGDFVKTPEDLNETIISIKDNVRKNAALINATRRQWYDVCRWLYRERANLSSSVVDWENCPKQFVGFGDLQANPVHLFGSEGYQPSRLELAEFEQLPIYVFLAANNWKHFPRYSWKMYSDLHLKAIAIADCYASPKSDNIDKLCIGLSPEEMLLWAVIYEGFAQHFLHDSFSSGHIGTETKICLLYIILCSPPKRMVEYTHDALNKLGLDVVISEIPDFPWNQDNLLTGKVRAGWTAFGDRHLFIPEAAFHRAVIIQMATNSIMEVLLRAAGTIPNGSRCLMCTSQIFPVQKNSAYLSSTTRETLNQTDLTANNYPVGSLVKFDFPFSALGLPAIRSQDARVHLLPIEGWKVSARYAVVGSGFNESGNTVSRDPATAFDLAYIRNTEPWWPNYQGVGLFLVPGIRTSYTFSLGYLWPRELSTMHFGIRGSFGWRVVENFTEANPDSHRQVKTEITFPIIDYVPEMYPPLAFLIQINPFTFIHDGDWSMESSRNHKISISFGLRLDLAGIL